MHLGLNKIRFWFLYLTEAPSIWGSHFQFLCVSVQTFSEILRISELATVDSVVNPSPRTGDSVANYSRKFYDSPRNIYTLSSVSRITANQKSTKIEEPQAQLPILLWDSEKLGDCLAWNASKLKIIIYNQRSIIKIWKPEAVHIQAQKSHATLPLRGSRRFAGLYIQRWSSKTNPQVWLDLWLSRFWKKPDTSADVFGIYSCIMNISC